MNFIKKYGVCALIGTILGITNGLLGAGGGIIATYYLSHTLNENQKTQNGVFANAVASMLPISLISVFLYISKGFIKIDAGLLSLLPCAIIGGVLGAFLLTKLKLKLVKIVFAILITVSGFMMIIK
jgi:uncharacterized membrane protein YfcA